MSKRLIIEKSGNATLVLSNGELQWDYVTNRLRVHDGYTAGGRSSIQMYSSGFSYVFPTPISTSPSISWDGASVTETIIRNTSQIATDYFGTEVGIQPVAEPNYLVVGAPGLDSYGSAVVFYYSGGSWTQQAKLQQSDTGTGDLSGHDVDIDASGTYVISGNPYDETETSGFNFSNLNYGAAYIFLRTGTSWSQQQKLVPSDRGAGDFFGVSVALNYDATYAICGATSWDNQSADAEGAAYVFIRSGTSWTQQARLQASDAQDADAFGQSVDLNGDGMYAIVGAQLEDGVGSNSGKAYVYLRTGTSWAQQAILTASDSAASDFFGTSVSLSTDGDYALVSAKGKNSNTGAAYVYLRTGSSWAQQAILTADDGESGDLFAYKGAISGDGKIAVLAARDEDGGDGNPATSAGCAYIFERDGVTWTQTKKLTASDTQASDNAGYGVDITTTGKYVIVGARNEDGGSGDPASNGGAAYIYEV
jgi:hypothetical protein